MRGSDVDTHAQLLERADEDLTEAERRIAAARRKLAVSDRKLRQYARGPQAVHR